MDHLDKLHLSCHDVEMEDAHKFYNQNPYMHDCIDKLIHGVSNVRFSLASIPKDRWFTVEQEEHVIKAFEVVEESIDYCLDQFRIKDL